ENAAALGVSDRIQFAKGDWLDAVTIGADGEQFDAVLSNPPYIPSAELASLSVDVRDFEPHLALDGGADGLDPHRLLLKRAGELIRPGGWLGMEIGEGQEDALSRLSEGAPHFDSAHFDQDLQGISRVCWLRRNGAVRSD